MQDIWESLQHLGLELPPAPSPVANYIPARKKGNLIYVSGQLPFKDGQLLAKGSASNDQIDELRSAAAQCFLNALAAAASVVPLEMVKGVVRIGGFVAADASFTEHAEVINGASSLAVALFGDKGRHARAAVGVSSLPLGASVEVEVLFSI